MYHKSFGYFQDDKKYFVDLYIRNPKNLYIEDDTVKQMYRKFLIELGYCYWDRTTNKVPDYENAF